MFLTPPQIIWNMHCQDILKIGLLHCKWSIKLIHITKTSPYLKHLVHIHRFRKGDSAAIHLFFLNSSKTNWSIQTSFHKWTWPAVHFCVQFSEILPFIPFCALFNLVCPFFYQNVVGLSKWSDGVSFCSKFLFIMLCFHMFHPPQ